MLGEAVVSLEGLSPHAMHAGLSDVVLWAQWDQRFVSTFAPTSCPAMVQYGGAVLDAEHAATDRAPELDQASLVCLLVARHAAGATSMASTPIPQLLSKWHATTTALRASSPQNMAANA